jgi:hypothetical protein
MDAAPSHLAAEVAAPALVPFAVTGDEHEDAVRKRRVRNKRAVDSAFKACRSSRLASKEPAQFVNMLSKAKAVKASRFVCSGGSPRLRAAVDAADFDGASSSDTIAPPSACRCLWCRT